jgi:lipopolysaccharide biosynthesis glycosyltransferase
LATRGVVYVAFGDRFVAEAVHSVRSLQRHCPGLPAVLFTDQPLPGAPFEEVRVVEVGHIRAKVDLLAQSPFDESLYLDSDTRVVHDLRDVFDVLDRFDLAMCHDFARKRETMARVVPEYAAIPYAFSEFNGGVILYSRSEAANRFLELWRQRFHQYKEQTRGWDQATLRVAAWESRARILTLPPEFNVRSEAVRRRVVKQRLPGVMVPRVLHWHGLHEAKWWHGLSPKYRGSKY